MNRDRPWIRSTSPREPETDGTSCMAISLDCSPSLVAYAAMDLREKAYEDIKSILKDPGLVGRGATLARKKKVSYGRNFGVQFYCDTITKKYDYHEARPAPSPYGGPMPALRRLHGMRS